MLFATDAAMAQSRTLKLKNVHNGETAEITYRRGRGYDAAGLKKINWFFRDWRRNEPTKIDPRVLDVLYEVYRNTRASGYIHIVSSYRSPATNSLLRSRSKGVAKKSQHMLGKAIDFYIPGVKLKNLRNAGLALQAGGVGYYPTSGSPFVHMDVGNVRHWGPGISDSEMASILRGGKRLDAGGGTVVAYADDTKRKGGLLSRLFGGGADEEEDNADTGSGRAASKTVVVKAPAAKPAPLPGIAIVPPDQATPAEMPRQEIQEEVVETPETIIAALPTRRVPVPGFAPREPENVPFQTAETAEEVSDVIAQAESALPVDGAAVPGEKPTDVALGVPLPSWRPDSKPAAAEGDATALLAMASAEVDDTTATDAFPVPVARPQFEQVASAATAAAPAPASAKQARVAAVQPVKTTRKAARPTSIDSKPDPKPVVVAAQPSSARWALDKTYVSSTSKGTKAPSFAYNVVRTAPIEVYTAGFQQGSEGADINRFTGKAVKFLTVARFQGN